MRSSVYTLFFILTLTLLSASDINTTIPLSTLENNTSSISEEIDDEIDLSAKNWFYYRLFITQKSLSYYNSALSGMDTFHTQGSDAVMVVGSGIDYSLYHVLSYDNNATEDGNKTKTVHKKVDDRNFLQKGIANDTNKSVKEYISSQQNRADLPQQIGSEDPNRGEKVYLLSEWFDDQGINDRFLDRSNQSYVRLRGGYAYNYRGDDEYIYSITARIKIPKTQEKLDLIIGDETKESSDLSLEGTDAERDNSIAVGMNNVLGLLDPVDTKLRLGFSGITNPYAKASFNYEALVGRWLIVPHQVFRYSYQDEFNEWTNLDFRRRVANQMIFSLLLQRSTITAVEGMNYFVQPSLAFNLGDYGNYTPYLGMYGRTKEQPIDEDGFTPKRGVYGYAVGLNWSKQASRKYIVYRLQPIVSYDDRYDFRPNYYIKALLEFYFGFQD